MSMDYKFNEENDRSIRTTNNREIYEKLRPSEKIKKVFPEHQAHGDDTPSKDLEKPLELFSYETERKSVIPPMSSSSNEFSFEMAMQITDTSNEALKTDDENGMTKSYFISHAQQKEKEIILSDVSLQQQLPINECEYEIDLGNGFITKSISSYQKKQQRTISILSADSIQPITTCKIPFTNTLYKPKFHMKEEIRNNRSNPPNVLFHPEKRWPKFSSRTLTIFSIGTTILIFLLVLMFFVV